jgi:hypothetical protein
MVVCETAHSVFSGIHVDLVKHYNWLLSQEDFAASVAADLEQLPES